MSKNETKMKINAEDVFSKSKRVEDRINVTFRIKKDLLKNLKRLCKEKDTTASSVVEVLLEQLVNSSNKES